MGLKQRWQRDILRETAPLCCCCCVCNCSVVRCFNLFLCLVKLCERLYEQERNSGLVCPGLGTDWCLGTEWFMGDFSSFAEAEILPWFVQDPESLCFFFSNRSLLACVAEKTIS